MKEKEKSDILKGITREECAELTKQLCDIFSPTGSEREIGEFVLDWYSRHGIKPIRQEIDPNRINAVGVIDTFVRRSVPDGGAGVTVIV